MLVSTSLRPDLKLLKQAERLSAKFGGRLVSRKKRSIGELRELEGEQPVLLATKDGLRLYSDDSQPLFFHPGMAAIRVQRLQGGDADPLVTATAVEAGDTVLDCTAGLASDAIVFSYVAGETGCVTALESEPLIYCLLEDGLARYTAEQDEITEAMRRIRLAGREHTSYLRSLPDKSFDIVYFDPMFRRPIADSASMSVLRVAANPAPISQDAVHEAIRVARKRVVLKEHRSSNEFARLGFIAHRRANSKIAYGVIIL
jgi:hypothetical protein